MANMKTTTTNILAAFFLLFSWPSVLAFIFIAKEFTCLPDTSETKKWNVEKYKYIMGYSKTKPCHWTSVRVKCHPNRVFSVEVLPFRNMDRSRMNKRFKITKFFTKNCDLTILYFNRAIQENVLMRTMLEILSNWK